MYSIDSSGIRRMCTLPLVILTLVGSMIAGSALAVPLEIGFALAWRQTDSVSRFSGGFDALFVDAGMTPNPRTDPVLGPGTVVTATQNGYVLPLYYLDAPAFPNEYFGALLYDASLTGAWTVTATNAGTSNLTATATTNAIGTQAAIAPVSDMKISGEIDSGFELSWTNPADTDGTRVFISELSEDGTSFREVHAAFLAAGSSSYMIPDEFSGSTPEEEIKLTAGLTYQVQIINAEKDEFTGEDVARAGTNFEFTATEEALDAFLPTVGPDGKFNFDIAVEPGEVISIDPFVATGYDYAIGDLLDPLFASVLFPFVGDDLFDLLLYNPDGSVADTINDIMAGTTFDFTAALGFGGGITGFGVRGIETSAFLDPGDPAAFVTDLTFVGAGRFTGTMTPITEFVPVPATLALFGLGLAGLGWSRRKKA